MVLIVISTLVHVLRVLMITIGVNTATYRAERSTRTVTDARVRANSAAYAIKMFLFLPVVQIAIQTVLIVVITVIVIIAYKGFGVKIAQ